MLKIWDLNFLCSQDNVTIGRTPSGLNKKKKKFHTGRKNGFLLLKRPSQSIEEKNLSRRTASITIQSTN